MNRCQQHSKKHMPSMEQLCLGKLLSWRQQCCRRRSAKLIGRLSTMLGMAGHIAQREPSAGLDTYLNVLAIPGLEGLQELQTGATGVDIHLHLARGRRLVGLFTCNTPPLDQHDMDLKIYCWRLILKKRLSHPD